MKNKKRMKRKTKKVNIFALKFILKFEEVIHEVNPMVMRCYKLDKGHITITLFCFSVQ